jgi:dTDP-4-amino-4,6-dideoxygalactose transaminase
LNVPILDLTRAHRRIATELAERWDRTLAKSAFILGPEVKELEAGFASYLGATGCVGVANGTDALVIALRALGLVPGDEVLVPAYSFFATAEAVMLLGATPVFVDVDPATCNLDPVDAAARVTPRTVGVIAVHLYGRPFDVPALQALCERRGLWLLEDAAQAHGAAWSGQRVGTFGKLAAWSFYPTKNLGCFGDGGAITGMDRSLLDHVFRLANHGQSERYRHLEVGTNSRLDSLQAAVLNCRLPLLDADNERRRAIDGRYRAALAGRGDLRFPVDPAGSVCVYHQAALFTAHRDELARRLAAEGVASALHYPSPLHRQPAVVAQLGELPDLPVSSRLAREVLCLPVFPELTDAEVDHVVAVLDRALRDLGL